MLSLIHYNHTKHEIVKKTFMVRLNSLLQIQLPHKLHEQEGKSVGNALLRRGESLVLTFDLCAFATGF